MNYKNHLAKLADMLSKVGQEKEALMISELANQAFDPDHDKGKEPWVVDIEDLSKENDKFRSTEWTGKFLQMTVMSLKPGEDIGLEIHYDVDQFIRIEAGTGLVEMGSEKDDLNQTWEVEDDFAIFIPAGTWHNIINTGEVDLKLYSIYAAPEHPPGTINVTKEDALEYEKEYH